MLPFEAIQPVVATGWLSLTDDKLALLVVLGAWLTQGWRALPTAAERRGLLPSLVFLLVVLISARLAPPEYAAEALRYFSRLLMCAFGLLVAMRVARQDQRQARGLVWALVVGGGVSALLGLGEALRWQPLAPVLSQFKVAPTRVGGDLRVSASFQYATIAAMYFEMVAPLAIVLAASAGRRSTRLIASGFAAACTAVVVLSLTRAGMLTLMLVYAVLLVGGLTRQTWRKLLFPTLASATVLVAGMALLLAHDPVFDLRLSTESDADWYAAVYSAPPSLSLQPRQTASVALDIRNQGLMTWTTSGAHPFALGYRWLTADGTGVLDVSPVEVALTHDVGPGETIHLLATVEVPALPAGTYRLDWGMLERDVLQFYERGWADAETVVSIGPSATDVAAAPPAVLPRDDGEAPWVVGRLDLWGAAMPLIVAHPMLGVGPDNFRHLYGAELGLETWDERIQANNLYLELLADLGVLGLAAFVWVIVRPMRTTISAWRRRGSGAWMFLYLGIGLALMAFLVHGLLDSFLAFTPTALLFWMLLGLASVRGEVAAQKPQVSGR